jgi:hypothetical protein
MVDELRKQVRAKLSGVTGQSERQYAAAVVILRYFLGENFIARRVRLSETPDPFLLNEFDEQSDNRFIHVQRVCALADYLYTLKEVEGFDVLLERLSTRETRGSYFEARILHYFQQDNFEVAIKHESGVKRGDFDFTAFGGGDKLNVEVTSCTNDRFSVTNLRNVLNAKRKQLPHTAPAALYCILPVRWFESYSDLQFGLMDVTLSFFRTTHRINYVCYVWDPLEKLKTGVVLAEVSFPIVNPATRHRAPDLSFLFKDKPPRSAELRSAIKHKELALIPDEDSNFHYMQLAKEST